MPDGFGPTEWGGQHWRTSDSSFERRIDLSGFRSPGAEFVEMQPALPPRPEPHFDSRFSRLPPINHYFDGGSSHLAYDGHQPSDSYFDPLRGSLFLNERQFGPPIPSPEPERPPTGVYFMLTPERFDCLMRDAIQQARAEAHHPFPTDVDFPP